MSQWIQSTQSRWAVAFSACGNIDKVISCLSKWEGDTRSKEVNDGS